LIIPDWPAPPNVRTAITTRQGGVSKGSYASLNLGAHVGDEPLAVAANRQRLLDLLPRPPGWLRQVHGTRVATAVNSNGQLFAADDEADAIWTSAFNMPCAVLTADCLPVLFCDRGGTQVAAAHAGWRGLCAGILENTVAALTARPDTLLAYLGPAIGPTKFEVGNEVRELFVARDGAADTAFVPLPTAGKFLADIYALARQRLAQVGLKQIYGGDLCTVSDARRFFSFRRERQTGRMASVIWLDDGKS
jgi:YfiH family protein